MSRSTYPSVPARISKGQGAGPEKGHFSALSDFQKRHVLGVMKGASWHALSFY
jgi:hypothetical protein